MEILLSLTLDWLGHLQEKIIIANCNSEIILRYARTSGSNFGAIVNRALSWSAIFADGETVIKILGFEKKSRKLGSNLKIKI